MAVHGSCSFGVSLNFQLDAVCGVYEAGAAAMHFLTESYRATFPAPDGMYTGYIAGDDDDSSFDSELDEARRDFLNI